MHIGLSSANDGILRMQYPSWSENRGKPEMEINEKTIRLNYLKNSTYINEKKI